LTYGDDAEVVAPAELRASIAAALRAAAGKYEDVG
jgi:predicted DNA-binding transcriptional regulator YafY